MSAIYINVQEYLDIHAKRKKQKRETALDVTWARPAKSCSSAPYCDLDHTRFLKNMLAQCMVLRHGWCSRVRTQRLS